MDPVPSYAADSRPAPLPLPSDEAEEEEDPGPPDSRVAAAT